MRFRGLPWRCIGCPTSGCSLEDRRDALCRSHRLSKSRSRRDIVEGGRRDRASVGDTPWRRRDRRRSRSGPCRQDTRECLYTESRRRRSALPLGSGEERGADRIPRRRSCSLPVKVRSEEDCRRRRLTEGRPRRGCTSHRRERNGGRDKSRNRRGRSLRVDT